MKVTLFFKVHLDLTCFQINNSVSCIRTRRYGNLKPWSRGHSSHTIWALISCKKYRLTLYSQSSLLIQSSNEIYVISFCLCWAIHMIAFAYVFLQVHVVLICITSLALTKAYMYEGLHGPKCLHKLFNNKNLQRYVGESNHGDCLTQQNKIVDCWCFFRLRGTRWVELFSLVSQGLHSKLL